MSGVRRNILLLWLTALHLTAFSQYTDSVELIEVIIETDYENIEPEGLKIELTSETSMNRTVADALRAETAVSIRSYGPGALQTIGIRGMSSAQTVIKWEDFKINAPYNGQIDLNLIPAAFFSSLTLDHAPFEAIGSTLKLKNTTGSSQRFAIHQEIASFGNYRTHLQLRTALRWLKFEADYFDHRAENNYRFESPFLPHGEEAVQKRGKLSAHGMKFSSDFRLSPEGNLKFSYWSGKHRKQIPETLSTNDNRQRQSDEFHRFIARYAHQFRHTTLMLSSLYNTEKLLYEDFTTDLHAPTEAMSSVQRLQFKHAGRNWQISTRTAFRYEQSATDGFAAGKDRKNLNQTIDFDRAIKTKWQLSSAVRLGLTDWKPDPLSASVRLNYLFKKLKDNRVYLSAKRDFRKPTLNDLYWNPGGNSELQAEQAWQFESGLNIYKRFRKAEVAHQLNVNASTYYYIVDNLIQWIPEQGGVWRARNVDQVRSAGLESKLSYTGKLRDFQWNLSSMYALTASRQAGEGQERGLQLIYVPLHTNTFQAGFELDGYRLDAKLFARSKRFITTDNQQSLPASATFDLGISKSYDWMIFSLQPVFTVVNVMNKSYQEVVNRPLPGRWYSLQIKLKLEA